MMTPDEIVQKYPRFGFLKTAAFQSLPQAKRDFLLGCIEDALFWVEMEDKPELQDGFNLLASQIASLTTQEPAETA